MVEPDEDTFHEYFCTVGSGLENFVANELLERRSSTVQLITTGKVYFSSNLSPEALLSLKTAERLFILVRKESQFLINRTKREAISQFRAMVEDDSVKNWERCLNKWKEFYGFLTSDEFDDALKFRVSCKCSGKIKNAFPSFFLGKILAGSLLNVHSKWIPELRSPQLEVLVHADMDSLTVGLACCLFNQPLSKRPYLSDIKDHVILRPTLCSAMLALALKTDGIAQSVKNRNVNEPMVLLDPMCGTGMILAEAALCDGISKNFILLGSDSDVTQISEAVKNVERAEDMQKCNLNYDDQSQRIKRCRTHLFVADARALPLQDNSVHCIVSDLPFGLKHTCEPWPNHLRKVLTKLMNVKDDIHSMSSQGSSNSTRESNDKGNINTSDDEGEEKIKPEVETNLGSLHGETVSENIDARKLNIDKVPHSKRGVKRKNSMAASVVDNKTTKVVRESSTIEDARNMLPQIIIEMDRVLVQGGRVVLIISEMLKPSLLEAVSFITSQTKSSMWSSDFKKFTDTSLSEVCTSTSDLTASDLESSDRNQGSFVIRESKEDDHQGSKRQGWSCTNEHKVRLGILNAVICVFNT